MDGAPGLWGPAQARVPEAGRRLPATGGMSSKRAESAIGKDETQIPFENDNQRDSGWYKTGIIG
jgi:hypothetical protein